METRSFARGMALINFFSQSMFTKRRRKEKMETRSFARGMGLINSFSANQCLPACIALPDFVPVLHRFSYTVVLGIASASTFHGQELVALNQLAYPALANHALSLII